MNLPTTNTLRNLTVLLLSALGISPMLLAQNPAEGWQQDAEGFYSRESERTTEYLALGSAGMAKITPLVEERLARAKALYQAEPGEETLKLVSALVSLLDQVLEMSLSGTPATAACSPGVDYGGIGSTQALACGNRAQASVYAVNNGNCSGPFSLYAFSQVSRDCGRQKVSGYKLRQIVSGWGAVFSSIQRFGPYSACNSYASAWALSPADNVIYFNEDNGSGTGCSTNPRSCPRCMVIHDDPT